MIVRRIGQPREPGKHPTSLAWLTAPPVVVIADLSWFVRRLPSEQTEEAQLRRRFNPSLYSTSDTLGWLVRRAQAAPEEILVPRRTAWLPSTGPGVDNLPWRRKQAAIEPEAEQARRIVGWIWITTPPPVPVIQLDWMPVRREPTFVTAAQPQIPTWVWLTSPLAPSKVVRPVALASNIGPVATAKATTPEAAATAAGPTIVVD